MDDTPPSEAMAQPGPAEPPPFADGSFAVPLTLELERTHIPFARLQAVREGAVLPLADESGRLAVRVLAGERLIATGSLVAIGEGYGVLIDTIHKEG
ncbi:FliM/FliN family flagellar motor C-terminal domain-containing protein [Sphingobium aromaticiconvertens]|uniref:FliM/FliN family flagellar motor C-terminal domain-containing protein n=1 Tax=Sphingobium aromaticiconvertens TaxID=365341 RepID=UPI003019D794